MRSALLNRRVLAPVEVPTESKLSKAINVLMLGLGLLALVLGCAFVLVSFLPFTVVFDNVSRFGGVRAGTSLRLDPATFDAIVERCRIGGPGFFGGAVVIFLFRNSAHCYLTNVLATFPDLVSDVKQRALNFAQTESPLHLGTLALIALMAIGIRLTFLSQPMRWDEATTFLSSASVPLYIGLSKYLTNNNHLLNTLLIHISYSLLGDAPWVIRLPAFVAGVLLVPASYLAIRSFYGKHVALISAGLVAASSELIEYSTNARGYSLLCLLWLLTLSLGAYLSKHPNPAGFLVLGLLTALGFYTIPIMLYPFGIVMVWLLLSRSWSSSVADRQPRLQDLALSVGVAGIVSLVLYSPVLVVSGVKTVVANDDLAAWRLGSWVDVVGRLPGLAASVWQLWNRDVPAALQFLLAAGFVTTILAGRRLTSFRVPLVLATVIWLVPVLLVQRVVPYERVWLFLLPLYFGMAVSGLAYWSRWLTARRVRWQSHGVSLVAVGLAVWIGGLGLVSQSVVYDEELERGTLREAEAISLFLKDYLRPGDRILATSGDAPLAYYLRRQGVPTSYFARDLGDGSGRLLIVLNEARSVQQTLGGVLESVGWSPHNGQGATVLRQYESATLYTLPLADTETAKN